MLLLHTHNFPAIFSITSIKETAAEIYRYVSEKINEFMPLRKHLIWVWQEDIKTKELMVFHGVTLSMGRCVKCSIKTFSLNSGYIFQFYEDIFSRKRVLHLYWALYDSPLPGAGTPDTQIQFLTREVKNVIDFAEPFFFNFIAQHNICLQMNQQ
jgi:hypothetical protein